MGEKWETLKGYWRAARFHADRRVVDFCDSVENAKSYVDEADKRIQLLRDCAAKAGMDKDSQAKLAEVHGYVKEVKNGVGVSDSVCLNYMALQKIRRALSKIDSWGIHDDDYASDAFGELFEGLGFFVAKLGRPLDAYAEIFKNAGHFFTDMRNIMNSGAKNTTGNRYADPYHVPGKWQ
jgi:hypothetical protein